MNALTSFGPAALPHFRGHDRRQPHRPATARRSSSKTILRPYWLTRKGEWERLITSGFVHADFGHLIFNMITFYFFAFPLERVIGTARFVVLYFLGLVLSDLGTWYKHRNNPEYASLGASGAILAVLFASIVYFPDQSLFIIPDPDPDSRAAVRGGLSRVQLVAVASERGPHQSRRAHRRRAHRPCVRGDHGPRRIPTPARGGYWVALALTRR